MGDNRFVYIFPFFRSEPSGFMLCVVILYRRTISVILTVFVFTYYAVRVTARTWVTEVVSCRAAKSNGLRSLGRW